VKKVKLKSNERGEAQTQKQFQRFQKKMVTRKEEAADNNGRKILGRKGREMKRKSVEPCYCLKKGSRGVSRQGA